METHVYANGNEICSASADGKAIVAPDPCWSPPAPGAGPVVIPYSNTTTASDLKSGSSTVFICGKPLALRDKSPLDKSTGNEPATRNFPMAVATHTITGAAYFVNWSSDVKVEGLNVCRHLDPLTHNHS